MTNKADTAYSDVVDIERYPISDLSSERGNELVQHCQNDLRLRGVCQLDGFLRPEAVDVMVRLATELADQAWATNKMHTVYFEPVSVEVLPTHPRACQVRSASRALAYDYVPADAPIRRLYAVDDMTRFVAAVLGKQTLYRSADPLDALQITTFSDGDELGWHFDRSEFSVTMMYQQPVDGGHFEYVPDLRSGEDQNFDGVQKVLEGGREGVVRLPSSPGTLAMFRGEYALHRVTPVAGTTPRVNSVLTYGERPDMKLNDLTSMLFYGRTS